jgi:hypothetical protein
MHVKRAYQGAQLTRSAKNCVRPQVRSAVVHSCVNAIMIVTMQDTYCKRHAEPLLADPHDC